jgi:hypothetical protein
VGRVLHCGWRFSIIAELFKSWSLLLEREPLFVISAGRIILEAACSSSKCVGEISRWVAAELVLVAGRFLH